jgi:hypothetical protein
MSVIGSNILAGASGQAGGGYEIERSLRFNAGDSSYLNRTPSSASNRKKWTWSGWIKKHGVGTQSFILAAGTSADEYVQVYFSTDQIVINTKVSGQGFTSTKTGALYRDPASWFQLIIAIDTTATGNSGKDRLKLYINGNLLDDSAYSTDGRANIAVNSDLAVNATVAHYIGKQGVANTYANISLADVHFIDGQALAPTNFGAPDDNGVWQPKEFTGAYTSTATTTSLLQTGWLTSGTNSESSIWDGSTSTQANGHNAGVIGAVSFNPPLTNVTKVELYTQNYNHYLNGSQISTSQSSTGWHTYYDNSSSPITLNSVGNAYTNNTQTVDLMAIRINGTIVNAQTWTPPSGVGLELIGANSFHLDFKDNSGATATTLGKDTSGNSNNWTPNNLVASVASAQGVAFDGNDSLTFAGPGSVTGDFTIECFVNAAYSGGGFKRIIGANEGSQSSEYTTIRSSGGTIRYILGDSSGYVSYNGSTIPAGQFSHVAITRSGSTVSYYLNGSRLSTSSLSSTFSITGLVLAHGYGSEYTTGTISNARVVNGQALYTGSSYTVPTGPLTTTSQGATPSNVTNLVANTSTVTANGGTGSAGAAGGNPTAVSADPFGDPADIDSLVDTPTNATASSGGDPGGSIVGNYCTLNPLDRQSTNGTLSNGNLDLKWPTTSWVLYRSTMHVSSGKWYWEVTLGNNQYSLLGIIPTDYNMNTSTNYWMAQVPNAYSFYPFSGHTYANTSSAQYTSADTSASGTTYGIALDLDAGTLTYYKNGVSLGVAHNGISGSFSPAASIYNASNNDSYNFGQRAFSSAAPAGYKSLNTANLPEPTIADGSKYFDTVLWSGDGSGAITVPGLSLNNAPGFVWSKTRNHAYHNNLWDAVRGFGSVNALVTDGTYAEGAANGGTLNSATSSSLTFSGGVWHNENNKTYAAWAWSAGANSNKTYAITVANPGSGNKFYADGALQPTLTLAEGSTYKFDQSASSNASHPLRFSTTNNGTHGGGSEYTTGVTTAGTPGSAGAFTQIVIAASAPTLYAYCTAHSGMGFQVNTSDKGGATNLDGTIASQVMASPESGFSIVTYTGTGASNATVGHGLNATPSLLIHKYLNKAENWDTWVTGLTADQYLALSTTNGTTTYSGHWGSLPTSSVFGVSGSRTNAVNTKVTYCFAPVAGYSAMGSYVGSSGNKFIYTGFKPRWIMIKVSSESNSQFGWRIIDTARDPENTSGIAQKLTAENSAAENTSPMSTSEGKIDILSNGFNIQDNHSVFNSSSRTYVYFTFASNPFQVNGGLAR